MKPDPTEFLKKYLTQISEMTAAHQFSSAESLVLEHGASFKSSKYPKKYLKWRGEPKECFKNAFWLALENDDLEYVEGYAHSIIPVVHAWCVDKSGQVIDPTWNDQEKCCYYGIKFNKEFVRKFITKNKIYGILGGDYRSTREILTNKEKFLESIISSDAIPAVSSLAKPTKIKNKISPK